MVGFKKTMKEKTFLTEVLKPLSYIYLILGLSRIQNFSKWIIIQRIIVLAVMIVPGIIVHSYFVFFADIQYSNQKGLQMILQFAVILIHATAVITLTTISVELLFRGKKTLTLFKELSKFCEKKWTYLDLKLQVKNLRKICVIHIFFFLLQTSILMIAFAIVNYPYFTLQFKAHEFFSGLAYIEFVIFVHIILYLSEQFLENLKYLKNEFKSFTEAEKASSYYAISLWYGELRSLIFTSNEKYSFTNFILHFVFLIRGNLMIYVAIIVSKVDISNDTGIEASFIRLISEYPQEKKRTNTVSCLYCYRSNIFYFKKQFIFK